MKNKNLKKLLLTLVMAFMLIAPITFQKLSVDATNNKVVTMAKTKIGAKYVYGAGHSMSAIANKNQSTFDCSSFVCWSYYQSGINIGNKTTSTLKNVGTQIAWEDLEVGDILLFKGHTGIYVGNNQMIHAPNTGSTVRIQTLSSYYKKNFTMARRVTTTSTATVETTAKTVVSETTSNNSSYKVNVSMMVRSGPDTSYKSVGSIKKGTTIKVVGVENTKWAKFKYNGTYRYVSLKYATKL